MSNNDKNNTKNIISEIISSTSAGIAQTIAGHPFDTSKVLYIKNAKKYNNVFDCVKNVYYRNGIRGFYKGISSPLAGSIIQNTNIFLSYSVIKNIIVTNDEHHKYLNIFYAGCLSGIAITFTESPIELVKIQLQINKNKNVTALSLIKKMGLRRLYQGFTATLVRNIPSTGGFFAGYEITKNQFSNSPLLGSFIGGSVAGFFCWGPVYPLDYIKTKIQSDHIDYKKRKYKNYVDCLKKINWKSCFKGFLPCIIRAVTVNPFVFLAYSYTKNI